MEHNDTPKMVRKGHTILDNEGKIYAVVTKDIYRGQTGWGECFSFVGEPLEIGDEMPDFLVDWLEVHESGGPE